MKNILKREYNKGKHVSQIIFHIFFILLILMPQLFFLINFPGKKLSKIKSNIKKIYYAENSTSSTSLFTFY